ncbi:MAG: hypothetical protein IJQ12_06215 [Lachnospiraceae bacterium]|nr:hypothetical protein [Lachnospiraceae bacterium]
MFFGQRLDRAARFQKEQNGHAGEEAHERDVADAGTDVVPEAAQGEKVSVREFWLMVLSAWAVFLPVALALLVGIWLVAKLIFRI